MIAQRRLVALLLLSVILITGWFELLALTGQSLVLEARRAQQTDAAEAPPQVCSTTMHQALALCHQPAKKTCGESCCAGGCRSGADCRCGTAHQRPREAGLLITAQGCHPLDGTTNGLIVPHSVSYRFLVAESPIPALHFRLSGPDRIRFDERASDRPVAPDTPPPRRFSTPC